MNPAATQRVPGHNPASADPRQLLDSLNFTLPELTVPPGYGFFLGCLATLLMLMPVFYVALIVFLGWLVVWHAYQALASLQQGPFFIFHGPMALLGLLLFLFLVKPVFFRCRPDKDRIVTLNPAEEPVLFAFVRKLCDAIGAPMPTRIEVNCDANASAGMDGLGGLFGGQFVLRIGLPLAAALPARQLAGVLAHEFGHFNQRSGMTGSYLVRRLSHFFARIVFERDRLDEKLHELRLRRSLGARVLFGLMAIAVEAARGVLWLLLMLAELLTCSVLRRMEYDADQREACITGVQDFIRTSRLLIFLNIAAQQSHHHMADTWDQRRLADDFPRLIVANARRLAEHRQDILKMLKEGKTRWFDTHPSYSDRVENISQLGVPALMEADLPSSVLFADFHALCKRATRALYRGIVDEKLDEAKLIPTPILVEEISGRREAFKALGRYFQGCIVPLRPVFPDTDAVRAACDARESARELARTRKEMLDVAPATERTLKSYEETVEMLALARSEVALCHIFSQSPQVHQLRKKAEGMLRCNQPLHNDAVSTLTKFEDAARRRLTAGLQLLHTDAIAPRFPEIAKARRQLASLLKVCTLLELAVPSLVMMRELALSVRLFNAALNPAEPNKALVRRINETSRQTRDMLRNLREDLGSTPYPFAHAVEGISIGAAMIQNLPKSDDPIDIHACVIGAIDGFCSMAYRTISLLTKWAEQVEGIVGLDPLPEPKARDDDDAKQEGDPRDQPSFWFWYGLRALAGTAMLTALVWFSIDPPIFSFAWQHSDNPGSSYRPAAFHVPMRQNTEPRTPTIYPPGYQDWRNNAGPRPTPRPTPTPQPGWPQPQPQPARPPVYTPQPQPPQPAQPTRPPTPTPQPQPQPARPPHAPADLYTSSATAADPAAATSPAARSRHAASGWAITDAHGQIAWSAAGVLTGGIPGHACNAKQRW